MTIASTDTPDTPDTPPDTPDTPEAPDTAGAAFQAWLATPAGQAAVNAAAQEVPLPAPAAAPDLFPTEPEPVPVPEAAPAASTAPAPVFVKGQVVVHAWDDPIDGASTRYGLVLGYDTTGDAPRAVVGWLAGPSGPITATELTAV
jgi:hypothetical protein